MSIKREGHTATLLDSGKVLVAGGYSPGDTASCELYDPATGTWTPTGSMVAERSGHKAVLQNDGTVLVAGGKDPDLISTEVYDPTTATWSLAGNLTDQRTAHILTRLANGTTLVAGGLKFPAVTLRSAEVFTPDFAQRMSVEGDGTFNSSFGTVTFSLNVTGTHGPPTGSLTFSDPDANVVFTRVKLRRLIINGDSAIITGTAMLDNGGGKVSFALTAVDNNPDGSSDTFTIAISNGYLEGGTLTSGNITIQ
jgi:hypothetical protein